jgi:hypothetical protein
VLGLGVQNRDWNWRESERERERAARKGGGLDRGRRAVRKSGELIML